MKSGLFHSLCLSVSVVKQFFSSLLGLKLIPANSAVRSALGVQRPASVTLGIHLASEPIREDSADDEDPAQYRNRDQDVGELFQRSRHLQAIECKSSACPPLLRTLAIPDRRYYFSACARRRSFFRNSAAATLYLNALIPLINTTGISCR